MKGAWLPTLLAIAALLFSALDFAYHYRRLPPRVASHFDARGNANGWSSKSEFVTFAVATIAFVGVMLAPVSFMSWYVPKSLFNVPNKDYWMAPEREAITRAAIAQWGIWFAAATLWLLSLLFHFIIVANLHQPPQLQPMWGLIGGYMAVVLIMVIQLMWRFSRTP